MDFRKEPQVRIEQELEPGEVFVAPIDNGGRLVGMISNTLEERGILLLGAVGTDSYAVGPQWMPVRGIEIGDAVVLPTVRFEVKRGELGYALPTKTLSNGDFIVDANQAPWIFIKRGESGAYVDLNTGAMGIPAKPVQQYPAWRLVWTPDGEADAIELLPTRG